MNKQGKLVSPGSTATLSFSDHISSPREQCSGGLSKAGHPAGRSHSDSPLVAVSSVVSTSGSAMCRSAAVSALLSDHGDSARSSLGWEAAPSTCLEALMQHFQPEGLEEVSRLAAAPRRLSTNDSQHVR